MGWAYVSELRQPTGLFFIRKVTWCVESHGGIILTGENRRTRRENFVPLCLPQIPYGLTGPRQWEAGDWPPDPGRWVWPPHRHDDEAVSYLYNASQLVRDYTMQNPRRCNLQMTVNCFSSRLLCLGYGLKDLFVTSSGHALGPFQINVNIRDKAVFPFIGITAPVLWP
jgi:hypothetical protein